MQLARMWLGLSLVALALTLWSRAAMAAQCHGVTMPPRAQVAGKTLVLNGMGTREATVLNVDVYVAGLYLERPTRDAPGVLREMDTMRLVLELVRDVDRKEMVEALHGGLQRNTGNSMPAFESRAARLGQMIPDLHEGDTVEFTYRPGGQGALLLRVNGQERGQIEGADFARAFFSIWLNKPPNANLKRGLLGAPCE